MTWGFYWVYIVALAHTFEYDKEVQEFPYSETMVAGLLHNDSATILCSGSLYSSFYVMTSCRCLYSSVAVHPYYKKRTAPSYRILLADTFFGVSTFVTHPYCMRIKAKKPYKNHFGLIVLATEFFETESLPPLTPFSDAEYTRQQLIELSQQLAHCVVVGHLSDAGEIQVGKTKMMLMTADECLFRLCIPKIGCKGKSHRIAAYEDFCLRVVDDVRLKARFLEGSAVTCGGHLFGIVVSPGSSRYPKVPTIFATVTQYLTNLLPEPSFKLLQ